MTLDARIRNLILATAKDHVSFYLYDEVTLEDRIRRLRSAFALSLIHI